MAENFGSDFITIVDEAEDTITIDDIVDVKEG